MNINTQPTLGNENLLLIPLQESDFEALYETASDEKIWEQHPNKDRWKREEFQRFFEGAIKSGGAFKIIDKKTGAVAGSTRFYDYNPSDNSIMIGYTFYATRYWGKGLNPVVKHLMLDYIFQYVDSVYFHVGASNVRSQIAMTRLGARKVREEDVAYYGEATRHNFVYQITKEEYTEKQATDKS
ncbi:GNAT family N-acetyltransferase [Chitinophaga sp. HK235]|uniref:GNAT family N-acetyltransferase n=1 Tax=Chitinophaga sp. HK235 TaxID=2952571 RepID=UPI001BA90771|nr:GNAT family N-acetyltransferase [Chitinophaga sp. HK235]